MESQFPSETLDRIERGGVVAVLVVEEVQHAVPLAKALLAGGVNVMELTLRTPAAIDCIKAIRAEVPEMLVGCGTILTPAQVEDAAAAGAAFGVAPGTNPVVIRHAQKIGLPFAPGVATASDIEAAVSLGCRELKFFPAEAMGGMKMLAAIKGPYRHVGLGYLPLGGLSIESMAEFLQDDDVVAIGGSWIAKPDEIRGEAWGAITEKAAAARAGVDAARNK